jgi:hypothetical protein
MDVSSPLGESPRALLSGAFVIFCRYASRPWLHAVEAAADVLAGVGLFVDDDIEALALDSSIPLGYRMRLLWRYHIHRRKLARHCDILFVATPELAMRHKLAVSYELPPLASGDDAPRPSAAAILKIAFHSTSVHAAEHRWLQPVMKSALAAEPSMSFEVIAGPLLSRRWQGLPRTSIVSPIPWPQYRTQSHERGADLLLAPLLPTYANAARSWTKRIDAMRLGAALLVSDPHVYRLDPEEEALGMRVALNPNAWSKAIVDLARDHDRLARLRDLNAAYVRRAAMIETPLITDEMLPP